jgi:hypothetical protein
MRASTLVHRRRQIGRWLTYSVPPEDDRENHIYQPDPDPPGEKKGPADPSAGVDTDHALAGDGGK